MGAYLKHNFLKISNRRLRVDEDFLAANAHGVKMSKLINIQNRSGRVSLNESVTKESMDRLLEEIDGLFGNSRYRDGSLFAMLSRDTEDSALYNHWWALYLR